MSSCGCRRCNDEEWEALGSIGLPPTMFWMTLCLTCGNKRCPHATDHRNLCTHSNELDQPGSFYGGNG